ncbi:MAG: hypothetical protein LBQ22_10435 [Bacteroidales bacterium]|jgi:hypothetical protein|nr:hypothetical protein [Bacteroidales bacterium]
MSSKKSKWKEFSTCLDDNVNPIVTFLSGIVTIAGVISIVFLFIDNNKKSKQERADELLTEAIIIFNNPIEGDIDYDSAYIKFLDVKKYKYNDTIGYHFFFELANELLEASKDTLNIKNNKTREYLREQAKKYYQYAASLNIYKKNKAKYIFDQLEKNLDKQ